MASSLRSVPDVPDPRADASEDGWTFEEFYAANFRRVYTSLFLVTGNRHEAEEIVQDAFLKVFERWDRVAHLDDPTGYVYRVAMNVFRNRYRRASLALRRALSLAPAETDELAVVESRDELLHLLRELAPQQRAAILLTSIWDLSTDEAGKLLGIKPSSVRSLTSRARDLMKHKAVDHP
jgi:RNA polymerase sigma factor (sigma-70 family)